MLKHKEYAYFQGAGVNSKDVQQIMDTYEPKIESNDLLSITISSLSPEATAMFSADRQGLSNTIEASQLDGYLVDKNGMIEMAIIGSLKVGGMTRSEVSMLIKSKLINYLKEPSVKVTLLNFKVSVMGEVARPAVYTVSNEKVSITEALSMAGDITIYGMRENVLLIREENGQREFIRINLNTTDVFNSPYYYLHKGDVIYVEPGLRKVYASENRTYQVLTVLLGLLNIAAIYAIK